MSRKIFSIIFIGIIYISIGNITNAQVSGYTGYWKMKSERSNTFTLDLYCQGDSLLGKHCSIFQNGLKMDCSYNDEITINSSTIGDSSITVTVRSTFSREKGKATITLVDTDTLVWDLTSKPVGEHYIPVQAVLIKQ